MVEQRVPWIFIAEDDESILDLLVTRLRIAGYQTTYEKDGLAARRGPDDIKAAIRLGATDYLSKPFDDTQLLTRVARLLRRRNAPSAPSKAVYI